MSENRHAVGSFVSARRLQEAMDKLDKHHPQIAGRLRTIWRREDDAWARGEELPPPDLVDDEVWVEPVRGGLTPPTIWERWRSWRQRF